MIGLIHSLNLVVINGRTEGDSEGEITFATRAGQSVNDYCLAGEKAIGEIKDMRVGTGPWSDHNPIELTLTNQHLRITQSTKRSHQR